MADRRRLVVIGGVAGGATAASKARRCCPEAEIEIYDQGRFISYAGCGLPYFLGGFSPDWKKLLARTPREFEKDHNIDIHLHHRVDSIDPDNKRISVTDLEAGKEFQRDYDTLVVATGAVPIMPDFPGKDLEGVFVLRSLADALEIKSFLDSQAPEKALIVGAGSIGLEMSEAFRRLGLQVDLVEAGDHVMPHLDPGMAPPIAEHLEKNGVRVHLESKLQAMESNNGRVQRVATSNGDIEADLVLVCIGIAPATSLAAEAGLELGARKAIKVDEYMRTSKEDILACGDCVTTRNYVTGEDSWIPLGSTSRKQGRTAGDTFSGEDSPFPGVQGTFILKVFEMTVGKSGVSSAEANRAGFEAQDVIFEEFTLPRYYPAGGNMVSCVTFDKKSGRLLGAQVVGDFSSQADKRLDIFATAIKAGMTANDLSSLDLAYAPPYSNPLDMPIIAGQLGESKALGKSCFCSPEGYEDRDRG
jgi:NADPH-dependent 2,4-dienoyl-CoA reductase/sulfur reductase-like enzyme